MFVQLTCLLGELVFRKMLSQSAHVNEGVKTVKSDSRDTCAQHRLQQNIVHYSLITFES